MLHGFALQDLQEAVAMRAAISNVADSSATMPVALHNPDSNASSRLATLPLSTAL